MTFARSKDWSVVVPQIAIVGWFAAAFLVGGLAGLYPAVKAARISPSEALRTT